MSEPINDDVKLKYIVGIVKLLSSEKLDVIYSSMLVFKSDNDSSKKRNQNRKENLNEDVDYMINYRHDGHDLSIVQ